MAKRRSYSGVRALVAALKASAVAYARTRDADSAGKRKGHGLTARSLTPTVRQINLTLSLAFLAPTLVKAAVEGRLPRGINIERLRDPHIEWSRQFQDLGLSL